jgi:hypothetical protein
VLKLAAAACFLGLLVWSQFGREVPVLNVPVHRHPEVAENNRTQRAAHGVLDQPNLETFSWPIEETSPLTVASSIPADLFD